MAIRAPDGANNEDDLDIDDDYNTDVGQHGHQLSSPPRQSNLFSYLSSLFSFLTITMAMMMG